MFSINSFFIALNSAIYLAIAFWFIRYRVIPRIRASLTVHNETGNQLASEVTQQRADLEHLQKNYTLQEREIARLTACVEKWAGVLSQRAANAEQESRELAFRYKERVEDNARARVAHNLHKVVVKQVLKDVRVALLRDYADPDKQQQFISEVCNKIVRKGNYGRA